MLERVVTEPDNYAPFLLSQGIRYGNLVFISGQAGAGDDGRIVEGGFRAQGEQAFANLRRALEAGGSSLKDVIKVTIFVTDMGHFADVTRIGADEYFCKFRDHRTRYSSATDNHRQDPPGEQPRPRRRL